MTPVGIGANRVNSHSPYRTDQAHSGLEARLMIRFGSEPETLSIQRIMSGLYPLFGPGRRRSEGPLSALSPAWFRSCSVS